MGSTKLETLTSLLEFGSDSLEIVEKIDHDLNLALKEGFARKVTLLSPSERDAILELWHPLNDDLKESILRHPIFTAQTLFGYVPMDVELWMSALRGLFEKKKSQTSRGDFVLCHGDTPLNEPVKKIEYNSSSARQIDGGFYFSEFFFELNQEQAQLSHLKIQQGLDFLLTYSAQANKFTHKLTRLIHLYGMKNLSQIGSSSFGPKIGLTVLRNPHVEQADRYFMAESLLHEAIHFALCVYELENPFIVNSSAFSNRFAISPWTGNKIEAHSLIHACAVWFGLFNFWSQVEAKTQDKTIREAAFRFRLNAAFGYLSKVNPLQQFDIVKNALGHGVSDWIYQLTQRVCAQMADNLKALRSLTF